MVVRAGQVRLEVVRDGEDALRVRRSWEADCFERMVVAPMLRVQFIGGVVVVVLGLSDGSSVEWFRV